MSDRDIIRAWKDRNYRESLSEEQRSQLPDNPAGIIELSQEEMESLSGGAKPKDTGTGTTSGSGCNCYCKCSAAACGDSLM